MFEVDNDFSDIARKTLRLISRLVISHMERKIVKMGEDEVRKLFKTNFEGKEAFDIIKLLG